MKTTTDEMTQLIIDALELEDVSVTDVAPQEPLFGDGLGLDSIDSLELGLALQKRFNIQLQQVSEDTRKHFYSVQTLTDFINAQT